MFAILPLLLAASATASAPALPAKLEAMSRAGNAEAAYHLGMLYHLGIQRPKDRARAFKLFMQASEAGDALGAFKVGCYYAGQSEGAVAGDAVKALKYKLIAAEVGYDLAQFDVAAHYLNDGLDTKALPWLLKAAQQGNRESLLQVVRISLDPASGAYDLARAYEYLGSALAMMKADGTDVSTIDTNQVSARLTTEQRAEADRRIAVFKAKPTTTSLRARAGLAAAEALAGTT